MSRICEPYQVNIKAHADTSYEIQSKFVENWQIVWKKSDGIADQKYPAKIRPDIRIRLTPRRVINKSTPKIQEL